MSETERAERRALAVAEAMADIAEIDTQGREDGGIDQAGVELIKQRLLRLAEHEDLFCDEDFPPPDAETGSLMYRIAQDGDRLALYIQTVGNGVWAPPHEHTTWAVIVGMRGQELNRLYGPCAGEGEPQVQQEVVVERGTGVAMLGDDVTQSMSTALRPISTATAWPSNSFRVADSGTPSTGNGANTTMSALSSKLAPASPDVDRASCGSRSLIHPEPPPQHFHRSRLKP